MPSLQLDTLQEPNLQLVQTYARRATAQKAAVKNFDGWLDRIDEVDGLEKDDLVKAHGQLIALGFLKFEILGSSVGLRYKISPAGKQALDRTEARLAATNGKDEVVSELPPDQVAEAA